MVEVKTGRLGSSFDDLLDEDGICEEVEAQSAGGKTVTGTDCPSIRSDTADHQ